MKGFVLTVHRQEWHYCTRYLIFGRQGSVMLDIVKPNAIRRDYTALIWGLWVTEEARQFGLATDLISKAEEIAASLGHKEVALEWNRRDTPQWVLQWYNRRGYAERYFDDYGIMLFKELKGGEK